MKRLTPFDDAANARRNRPRPHETGRLTETPVSASVHRPEGNSQRERCALPYYPEPRRTAFFAMISDVEDGLLYVREAPIEIVRFHDTELVHFSYLSDVEPGDEQLVTITSDTCFDVSHPYQLLKPYTPVIVVGLDLGLVIAAEIIADMNEEARYRPLLMRYQMSRQWYVALSDHEERSRRGS